MSYRLRPYQRLAVDATVAHFRTSQEPACLVLPTGAGKSLVIAELCRLAQGRVLALAHVKELCQQNYEKLKSLAPEASVGLYSAGLGKKEDQARIVFGGVQSVAANLPDFKDPPSLIIVDECHRVSLDEDSQYQTIFAHFRKLSPQLKVLGLSATPYRLGLGFCYQRHVWGMVRSSEDKPFRHCLYEVTLKHMVDQGYLTPPLVVDAPIAQYDFGALEQNTGTGVGEDRVPLFEERAVNSLLVRHRRVTRAIVEQIVTLALEQDRRGVMIFAATVEHAEEILSYLPEGSSGLVVGSTKGPDRDRIIKDFCAQKLKYLVNVSVLTTGFDAPHVDFIALLRRTESVSLFQQIAGRGLRLYPGKRDCLVIDYAGNGFNIFAPEIGEKKPNAQSAMVQVRCPSCEFENDFWGIKDDEGRVIEHYGRRCTAFNQTTGQRCDYRFRFKECPSCNGENDIAARTCSHCETRLIDPDDLLKNALKLKDALVLRVSGVEYQVSDNRLTLIYHDEDGAELREYFDFGHRAQREVFNRTFSRRLASGRSPLELETAAQAAQLSALLPTPDFVVARAKKAKGRPLYYQVKERVFDYTGRYRKAASAS